MKHSPSYALSAYAGPSKPPTPDKGSASTQHVITCDYWAGLPYWTSGTTVAGKAYWSCSDSPDVQQVCALIQVKDKSGGSWVSTGSSSTCTSSTTRASNVTDYGNCIGSPGNWTWSYRVY